MKQHMMSLWGDPTSNEGEQIEKRPFLSLWALKQLIKLQDKSHKDYPEYHNLVCPSKGGGVKPFDTAISYGHRDLYLERD